VRDVKIASISLKSSAGLAPLTFAVTDPVPDIGAKLTIELPTATDGKSVIASVLTFMGIKVSS
jgi:hypothetical protein